MIMTVSVLLLIAAGLIAYIGLGLTARSNTPATVEVVYLEEFTLAEPYVKYVNGRKATKYVL